MKNVGVASRESFYAQTGETRETLTPAKRARFDTLAGWVVRNSGWVALLIIVAAFALRLYYVVSCYLNSEEAVRFLAARPHTWHEAYKASRMLSDPPLFVLILHWTVQVFGRSELIVRLPSLIGSTVALWFSFAWIRRSIGEIPALAGLIVLAASQSAITAGTEARPYGILLFFLCGALYATERAFSDDSPSWAIIQGLFLAGAVLSHYTALLVIPVLGIYVLLRCLIERAPRRVLLAFVADQFIVASVATFLYLHLIRNSPVFSAQALAYLGPSFWEKGQETFLDYSWRCAHRTFTYFIGFGNDWSHPLAFCFFLVVVAGLAAMLTGRVKAGRLMAFLIIAVFAVGYIGSLMELFPFAGTRHQVYLLPFFAAGLGAALKWIPRGFATLLLILLAASASIWAMATTADNDPGVSNIRDMRAVVDYINRTVPAGAPLFVDELTRLELTYYLGRNDASLDNFDRHIDNEEILSGRRIISPPGNPWEFDLDPHLAQANEAAQAAGVRHGDPIWIVSVQYPFPTPLASVLPPGASLKAKSWGPISIIETVHQ